MQAVPYRRRAFRSVLIALALGVATTVAIAWGLAVGVDTIYHVKPTTLGRTPGVVWVVEPYSYYGARTEGWSPVEWFAPGKTRGLGSGSAEAEWESPAEFEREADSLLDLPGTPALASPPRVIRQEHLLTANGPVNLIEHYRGWPLLALGCARVIEPDPMHAPPDESDTRGWRWGILYRGAETASWGVDCLALPLKPLWPGFYADTLIFGAAWWAVLFWRPMRRARRISRGLCPACAYDLAGLPPETATCPECGSARPLTQRGHATKPAAAEVDSYTAGP